MHLPPSSQYFCICPIENQMEDFFASAHAISVDYGIQINMQPISYEACLDLVKNENDRNFYILIRSDSQHLRKACLDDFNVLFITSSCFHKLALITEKPEEVRRDIYFTLLGSLNLACVFSRDGHLNTYGIQVDDFSSDIRSTLISTNPGPPVPIEIVNVKPIILDMTRCGILEPVLYFVARDFGTCIAQVLLPDSSVWILAYLIQCDDSGRNDLDMVKVCLIEEEPDVEVEETKISSLGFKEMGVLINPKYALCRDLVCLIHDLKHLPANVNVMTPLLQTIRDAIDFAKSDDFTIFPDATDLAQVKRKYARLFKELSDQLVKIPNQNHQKRLQDPIKTMRRLINVLNVDAKGLKATEKPTIITKIPQWMEEANLYSSFRVRTSPEAIKTRKTRLENEQKDGIVSTPLLEPYLEVIWPRTYPLKPDTYSHPIFKQFAQKCTDKEMDLQLNKRFGV